MKKQERMKFFLFLYYLTSIIDAGINAGINRVDGISFDAK